MAEQILDGTGGGYEAKVDSNNRLHVDAITEQEKNHANENGNAYNINTLDVTLTTAGTSAVLYIKNNENKDLVIPKIIYIIGTATGGSGDYKVEIIRNPTAGTIISTATAAGIVANRNFGSSNALDADVYKGTEGATFTNGTKAVSTIFASTGIRATIDIGEIALPKGASLGVEVTPPTGNTSLTLQIAIESYLHD